MWLSADSGRVNQTLPANSRKRCWSITYGSTIWHRGRKQRLEVGVTEYSRQWRLFWSDEFDGEAGTPINDTQWTREVGSFGADHHELQYYTDQPENAFIDGKGNL